MQHSTQQNVASLRGWFLYKFIPAMFGRFCEGGDVIPAIKNLVRCSFPPPKKNDNYSRICQNGTPSKTTTNFGLHDIRLESAAHVSEPASWKSGGLGHQEMLTGGSPCKNSRGYKELIMWNANTVVDVRFGMFWICPRLVRCDIPEEFRCVITRRPG